MSRLRKYAKKFKTKQNHQYPWKPDIETFVVFQRYCEGLNLSINEGLTLLVKDEIKEFRKTLSEEKEQKPKEKAIVFTPLFDPETEKEEKEQENQEDE